MLSFPSVSKPESAQERERKDQSKGATFIRDALKPPLRRSAFNLLQRGVQNHCRETWEDVSRQEQQCW